VTEAITKFDASAVLATGREFIVFNNQNLVMGPVTQARSPFSRHSDEPTAGMLQPSG
jgi:hypothetical protein